MNRLGNWGLGGALSVLFVQACSGTTLNELGDINSRAGAAGASRAGASASDAGDGPSAGTSVGGAGSDAGSTGAGFAGEAGSTPAPAFDCPTCQLVVADQDVRAIAVDDTRVLWADYGTFDAVENYEDNGRLLMRNLDGGEISVLASSLSRPEDVGLSASYAYVYLAPDGLTKPSSIVRIPLAGGPAQTVRELDVFAGFDIFARAPGYEYWLESKAIYRIADAPDAQPELVVADITPQRIAIDGTTLFYDLYGGISSKPLAGGDPTPLSTDGEHRLLDVAAGFVYALESPPPHSAETDLYLVRMPTAGGTWKRVAKTIGNYGPFKIAVDGSTYLTDEPTSFVQPDTTFHRLSRGTLSSSSAPEALAGISVANACIGKQCDAKATANWRDWEYTRAGVFLSGLDGGLYMMPAAP